MAAWAWAAASFGLNLVSGLSSRSSAKKARNAEEAFLQKKYEEYDLPMWEMNKEKLIAQRDEIIRQIELQQRNEKRRAEFQDLNNLRNYNHELKIREVAYQGQVELKKRSDFFTNKSQQSAIQQHQQEQFQTRQQYAFENEENIVDSIIQKGELAATSQSGKSAVREIQSEMADKGRQVAIMTENMINARTDGRMRLNDFLIQTEAQRMIEPSRGVAPLKPLPTPVTEYQLPRALEEFDFGPQPIPGVAQQQVPSMLGTIASAGAAGATTFSNMYKGTNKFEPPPPNTPPPTLSTQNFGSNSYSLGNFNYNSPTYG